MNAVAVAVFALLSSQTPPSWITPSWVEQGSHMAKVTSDNNVYYGFVGVGVASKIKDSDRLKAAATQRARTELTKILEAYTVQLASEYFQSSRNVAHDDAPSLEQIAKLVAEKATISEVHVDGETQAMYVRADLQLDAFVQAVAASELSTKYKLFIKHHARRVHDASIKRDARPADGAIPDNYASL